MGRFDASESDCGVVFRFYSRPGSLAVRVFVAGVVQRQRKIFIDTANGTTSHARRIAKGINR